MPVIEWFLWRRWQFKRWAKGYSYEPLTSNLRSVNFGHCRDYPIIYRDMVKIIARSKQEQNDG